MRESAVHVSPVGGSAALPNGVPVRLSYTVPDAATQLSLSERVVWRLIKSGAIASFRTDAGRGGRRLISHHALQAYITEREQAEQQLVA